ncbi:telomere-capping, CST complex subunit-domain-containing protein [Mucor lusitanicus]|uniref:OB domain-containing protein n=1 Tax=Mucor lusitanicus CBS 277.49 TaxID=747725 RepID=A0A162RAK7_MUCCL|nr:hypothetical protein MUCCIDRAFT_81724 [Mucor lusitanicus CBS 277.49]
MSNVPSARLVLFKDLANCKTGDSVRVTGLWQAYDDTTNTALMEYDNVKANIRLEQIDQPLPQAGDVVQCIGEIMEMLSNTAQIQARIVRSVNTIDMELYEKVVELRNSVI